jgi:hypothetical protein
MAYHLIHTQMWKDDWFLGLEPDEKLLFVYLFSNESIRMCGMYPLSLRATAFETNIGQERVEQILSRFESDGKVHHHNGWVWVMKFIQYNCYLSSPKTRKGLENEYHRLPDTPLKTMVLDALQRYGIIPYDRVCIPYDTVGIPLRNMTESESDSESDHDNNIAPSAAAIAAPAPPQPKREPYTEEQRRFLSKFNAKRFANYTQADTVKALIETYPATFWEAVEWAAERGMALGKAIGSIKTALPGWGKRGMHGINQRDNGKRRPIKPALPSLEDANWVRERKGKPPLTPEQYAEIERGMSNV